MKKIKVWLNTGFAGCVHENEFEVDDDATEEEIEEMAKEIAFNDIDWGWSESE